MKTFDYKKYKTYTWDAEIINLLTSIYEYKGRQDTFIQRKPGVLKRLVEIAKVQSVEDSNKIEGIVTTAARIKSLLSDKTAPRNRDEEEIMGYRDVLNSIHESYEYIPVTSNYILQLHKILYKYSEKRGFGGAYKSTQNTIIEKQLDGTIVERFTPLAPYETPQAVESICKELEQALQDKTVDALLLIPIFIHDFLCIHPFNDGNGRMSRLLTTLLLYREGYMIGKYISLESKIERFKEGYYEALEQSGVNWHESKEDVTPFVKYILRIILACYVDFEERVDYIEDKPNVLELVRRAIDSRLGKFTKLEMMELVPTVSKATIENTLKRLVEEGYIERHGKGKKTFYVRGQL